MKSSFTAQPILSTRTETALVPSLVGPTPKPKPVAVDWSRAIPKFRDAQHTCLFAIECLLNPNTALSLSSATREELQRKLRNAVLTGEWSTTLMAWKIQAPTDTQQLLTDALLQGHMALLFIKPSEMISPAS